MSSTSEIDRTRVEALERYAVLEAPPRRELTSLVELAAAFTGVPMATINLITDVEQVQVATCGFEGARMPRADSFCTTVVEEGRPIVIEDARLDARFASNPHTTGEKASIRFYGAHPLVTPEGVPIGTLCVYDEETHPVTSEVARTLETLAHRVVDVLELELTSRRLALANERLGAFAGQVSHDLRGPLTTVRAAVELAHQRAEELGDTATTSMLQRAERGARRMDEMIGELLTFARMGASMQPGQVDLSESVAEVLEDLATLAVDHQVEIGELPSVQGDAVQLRVLLQNLLANALKFSPPDGQVAVVAVATENGWRVEVADSGPGVPPDERERIFEPMVRLDTDVPGTGIGLATARRIVEAHGGRIGVTDDPDGGARFWFELPR